MEHNYVMATAQFDGFQLGTNTKAIKWEAATKKKDMEAYRKKFQAMTRQELAKLPRHNSNIFSTSCGGHVTANAAGYWNIHVKPSSGTSFTNLDHMVRLAISGSFGNWVIADCALGDKCSSDGCKKTV